MDIKDTELIPLTEEYLEMILEWRNAPEVRKNMYTSHEISLEEHKGWFKKIKHDNTKRYFVFTLNGIPKGVVGFVDIDNTARKASWAFYSGDTTTRGIGSLMEITALDHAFRSLELNKLHCEVISFNEPVIRFHRKHGFQVEGVFKKHHLVNEVYYDVYRLAIFKSEWLDRVRPELIHKLKGAYSAGKCFEHSFFVSKNSVEKFAGLTGDTNPIHLDDKAAKKQGFDKSISHGYLVGAVFSKVFGTMFPGEGTIYLNQSMIFHEPVYPNTDLIAKFKVVSKVGRKLVVSTSVEDSEANVKLDGEASLLISKEKA